MEVRALIVEPSDNVAVVIQDVNEGDIVETGKVCIKARECIKQGHKIALVDIKKGDMVKKYGVPIGRAIINIKCGSHVHTHNMEDITEQLCSQYIKEYRLGSNESEK